MYLSEKWTKKQVGTICNMIKENCTPEQMYNYLSNKQEVLMEEKVTKVLNEAEESWREYAARMVKDEDWVD